MEQQIRAILSGLPDVRVKQTGGLWQVSVGGLSGARQNGESLARDLRRQYEYIRDRERAAESPEATYTAIKQSLVSEMHAAEPEPVEVPMFLQAPEPEVMDVLQEAGLTHLDSYERVNGLLVQALTTAKGSAELARTYGGAFNGKSVVEWERKAQSINESIHWNSGRKVETL